MGHYDEQYEAEESEERYRHTLHTNRAVEDLEDALAHVRDRGNSREASIAITHIETAILWLRK